MLVICFWVVLCGWGFCKFLQDCNIWTETTSIGSLTVLSQKTLGIMGKLPFYIPKNDCPSIVA